MTADEQALLNAIIAAPEDDLPRLVYADWLEEHGRAERAEFIRLQCRIAELDERFDAAPERVRLSDRVRELHDTYSHLWRRELPVVEGVRWAGFDRGMIETVLINFWGHGFDNARLDSIFAVAPLVAARVRASDRWILSAILEWPAFSRFRALVLIEWDRSSSILHREAARILAAHKWKERPEMLDLRASGFDDEALEVLSRATDRSAFPVVDLRGYDPQRSGVIHMRNRFGERVLLG